VPAPESWRSHERRYPDGAVDSVQRVALASPAVTADEDGARRLGTGYWRAVQRASVGLVRPHVRDGAVELRLLGRVPVLLRLDAPRLAAAGGAVTCSYPIVGGALARRPGGTLSLSQTTGEELELRIAVEGYVPRRCLLYRTLQRRFHAHVSRRYLRRLPTEARR
jgi:hypothetical protein